MKTNTIFENKTGFSFEVFPPKKTSSIDTIYSTLEDLKILSPDFISVTYGAGGSNNSHKTIEITSAVQNKYNITGVAHMPCVNLTKDDVLSILEQLKNNNIENILALRGDIVPGVPPKTDFKYASDLVAFIKQNGDFNVLGACYPEGHTEAGSLDEDIDNLKIKVDAGVGQLVSQLFFNNDVFYEFLNKVRQKGINLPIEAGIMPVTNKKQIERMVTMCGASLPKKFSNMMNRYADDPVAMRDAGIAYAIDQIVDLISCGVDGIHLYTMNNPYIAAKISQAVENLIKTGK